MISDVKTKFDKYLVDTFKSKPQIAKFLLKHERKNVCLNNLCEQIVRAEKGNIIFNSDKYSKVITDVAHMFATQAIKHVEEQRLSESEIKKRYQNQDSLKEAEQSIKELSEDAKNDKIKFYQPWKNKNEEKKEI